MPVLLNSVTEREFLETSYSVRPFVITPNPLAQTNLCIGAVLVFASIPFSVGRFWRISYSGLNLRVIRRFISSDCTSLTGLPRLNLTCHSLFVDKFSHLVLKFNSFEFLSSEISTVKKVVTILNVALSGPFRITLADFIFAISYESPSTGAKFCDKD